MSYELQVSTIEKLWKIISSKKEDEWLLILKMRGMCFDFKWVTDLKSVCNSDQTIFSCKSFWVKSWWQPMKLGIRWWSSESSNEKNVGTRFYLVIVRKHTKVKHLRLFQHCADDCVSDQVLWWQWVVVATFRCRKDVFLSKKSCTFCSIVYKTILHFWADKNVRFLRTWKNVYLPIFIKIYISSLHILQFRSRLLFPLFYC